MRIAIFHELPRTTGSRKAIDKIAEYLSKNHTLDLFYTDTKPTYKNSKYIRKVFFYEFSAVDWKGGDPVARLYRDTVELVKLFLLHRSIAKDIRKEKYDFVFIHGSYLTESPFILLFKNHCKIYYAHSPNYTFVYEKVMGLPKKDRVRYLYEVVVRYVRRFIDRLNVRHADLILANSYYTKKKISSYYGKKSKVSYLGIDTTLYRPLNKKKRYDYLFIGSYHPVDGYDLLYQALEMMRKKPQGKVLAIEEEWIDDDFRMIQLYNSSKVVLCLSHSEPFGLVAVEAMACGVPVIAVDEAGYKETVVNKKTGYLIKRSKDELKKTLTKVLKDNEKRIQLSKQARKEAVSKWSLSKTVKSMEEIISNNAGI